MSGEWWIIDTEAPGELGNSKSAVGPFATRASDRKWLREESLRSYDEACQCLRKEWITPVYLIVRENCRVRPEIHAKVTCVLSGAEGEFGYDPS